MKNSKEVCLKEGKIVWCDNTPSTSEQNDILYSLCRVIENKNEQVLLTECNNGNNGCTFVCDPKHIYKANRQQYPLDQDDIINLKYINNPTVLHHLYERYTNEIFYTKMGPLLIYINPNKDINDDNDNDKMINSYKYNRNIDELNVNAYYVAKMALSNLNNLKKSQSIIITGESGSGRNEILKNIINFLSYTNDRANSLEENNKEFNVSEILKISINILDAFGNAKTEENNNCSRFTKIYTIFMNGDEVHSFEIKKLLLDKERLINRGINESSFNVFYYILNGSDEDFKRKYYLNNMENYNMLKNENPREKSNDEYGFSQLLKSLQCLLDEEKEIDVIFSFLSALLLLGNIEVPKNSGRQINNLGFIGNIPTNYEEIQKKIEDNFYNEPLKDNTEIFLIASKLLNINPEVLLKYFTKNDTRNDAINSRAHNKREIKKRIESFIKTCYEELLNWIILKINNKGNIKNIKKNDPYINILDVVYFENLKENSLDELLINTTNEAIRKIYVDFFFKKMEHIYKEEGIESNELTYIDNENLYKALISKEESIFSLLENACLKRIFDKRNLCSLITQRFHDNTYIKGNSLEKNNSFVIVHSNEEICYKTENIISKNVDILTLNFIELIKKSENTCMQQFCSPYKYDITGKLMEENVRYSVYPQRNLLKKEYNSKDQLHSTLLRNHLLELTKVLESTFCHFILCINPNKEKRESYFDRKLVINQLNKFHIFEIAQLKNGYYPYIFTLDEFLKTFRFLLKKRNNHVIDDDFNKKIINMENTMMLLNSYNINTKDWRIGKNMVFLNENALKVLIYHNLSNSKISKSNDNKIDKIDNELSSNEKIVAHELEKVTEHLTYSTELLKSNIQIENNEKVIESFLIKKNTGFTDRTEEENRSLNEQLDIVQLKNVDILDDDENATFIGENNKSYTNDYDKSSKSRTSIGFKSFKETEDLIHNMESRVIDIKESNNNSHNNYGVMNFINSYTIYNKKLREIHQALKNFDPINNQLKKDSVFNLGMENFYTENEIFGDLETDNKDKKSEKVNEEEINDEDVNKEESSEDEIYDEESDEDQIKENMLTEEEINKHDTSSTKLNESTYQDDNDTFIEKNKSSFDNTINGEDLDENFTLSKIINLNPTLCCQNNLTCCMKNLLNFYNYPGEINHENYSIEKKVDKIEENNFVNHIYNHKINNNNQKLELLDELNNIYIYNSNEKDTVINILKNMKNDIEKKYGHKWNIFLCSSDCYFRSYATKDDELVLEKNCNELKNKIMYSQEYYMETKINKEVFTYGNTHIVEYIPLPEHKKEHEILISNNVNEKYLKDSYKLICCRSRKVNKFDFLSARSFYKSIDYKILQTRNITHAHTDFSYMDDKMKNNFKQHVINEFINDPNISMEYLSYSLLNLATYFYPERNGTWCVFISTEKSFAGIVNIVKNRYLRMSIQNRNQKYNVVLFETPS